MASAFLQPVHDSALPDDVNRWDFDHASFASNPAISFHQTQIMNWLARQKFRFDLGQGFLALVNFSLLAITASDKIASVIGISAMVTVLLLVPFSLCSVWLLGLTLDKSGFAKAYQAEQNHRNEMLKSLIKNETTKKESGADTRVPVVHIWNPLTDDGDGMREAPADPLRAGR